MFLRAVSNQGLLIEEYIPETNNIYTYGKSIAEKINPLMKVNTDVLVTVYEDDGTPIHVLEIIPTYNGVMVTENSDCTFSCRKTFTDTSDMEEKYLVYVNADHNNNKYYRLLDLGNGKCGAFYGRIGNENSKHPTFFPTGHETTPYEYPAYMFWIKYYEKISKGYKDVTELHASETTNVIPSRYAPINDSIVNTLMNDLLRFSHETIKQNYTVPVTSVTPAMIEAADTLMEKLRTYGEKENITNKDIYAFNDSLTELFTVLPRRIDGLGVDGVISQMAINENDIRKIIVRESSLIDVVRAQVKINTDSTAEVQKTILESMGIQCHVATVEQYTKVVSMLSDSLKPKVKNVFRVINTTTQKRFNRYLNTHCTDGQKPRIKELWHGSRNENWIGILSEGLLLKPDAIITGKMFGNGIYFSPSSMKSWGYTSAQGSFWANGHSNQSYMALFATAYGNPYTVTSYNGNWYGYNYRRLKAEHPGYDCLHADSSKGMLNRDEIVFYREDQMTINFIVEFYA